MNLKRKYADELHEKDLCIKETAFSFFSSTYAVDNGPLYKMNGHLTEERKKYVVGFFSVGSFSRSIYRKLSG